MGTTFAVVLFTVLITVLAVLYFLPAALGVQQSSEYMGPISLSSNTTIITKDYSKFWVKAPKSTIQFFIYLSPMNRTSITHTCADNPTQGKADCETERFPICNCGGEGASPNDCSPCVHQDYYQLLSVFGIVQLEISTLPDASRQSQPSMQLLVRTETPLSGTSLAIQSHIETLPLPPILYQTWTMITIAREGRRFDIYYNETLVLSTLTLNSVSQTIRDDNAVSVGNHHIIGVIGYFSLRPTLYNSIDVTNAYKKNADTRGRPYLPRINSEETKSLEQNGILPSTAVSTLPFVTPSTGPTTGPFSLLSICPTGSCFKAPEIRPSSPLLNWTTNYG
jgi:hypothetical protein